MQKSSLVALIMGTVSGVLFALGMCMCLVWEQIVWGTLIGLLGIIMLIALIPMIKGINGTELFAKRITGVLLVVLSFCIVGVTILSALKERGTAFHEIVMITIATYTFTKITIAIVGTVKTKQSTSPVLKTLRNISLADACVLIYTMQRSMLVTFPGMKAAEIQLFNILTGTTVWIIILFLGMNLIGGKRIDMATSKSLKL